MTGRSSFLIIFSITMALLPLPLEASSVYYADTDRLELINDSYPQTYLSLQSLTSCRVIILSDQGNVYPWGKDAGELKDSWPLSDKDWPPKRLQLVNRIRSWAKLAEKQKIQSLDPSIRATAAACIQAAESEIKQRYKDEKRCLAQNKSFKDTSQGRLCLSDFEYAQLKILEEKNTTIENDKYDQRVFQQQQQERLIQEQREQQQELIKQQQRQSVLNTIMNSRPRYCYGSAYGGYGGFSTFNTSCY